MNLPTLKQLTAELALHKRCMRAEYSLEDLTDDSGNSGMDIRIQYVDGSYSIHTGDNQYDTDHRGAWGYGFVGYNATVKELRDEARRMLEEVRGHQEELSETF